MTAVTLIRETSAIERLGVVLPDLNARRDAAGAYTMLFSTRVTM